MPLERLRPLQMKKMEDINASKTKCGSPHVVMIPGNRSQNSLMENMMVLLYGLLAIVSLIRLVIPSLFVQKRRKRGTDQGQEYEGWQPLMNTFTTDEKKMDNSQAVFYGTPGNHRVVSSF